MKRLNKTAVTEFLIVALVVGVLLAVAVPNFLKNRRTSRLETIVANLRLIEAAQEQCAMDLPMYAQYPLCPREDLIGPDENYLLEWPTGPVDGEYIENSIGTNATFRGKDSHAWKADPSGL
jgi:type II secretory pathway pseudopilin PulG